MLNNAALTMFGYQKGELEGKNVAILMCVQSGRDSYAFFEVMTQQGPLFDQQGITSNH